MDCDRDHSLGLCHAASRGTRVRRPMRIVLVLLTAGLLLGGPGVTTVVGLQHLPAADTGWTLDKPLTGRAITCENGRIKILDCRNVELLSYLPPSMIGDAGKYDIWGWTDS